MRLLKKLMIVAALFSAQLALANDTARVEGHPKWILQGNIYEVNVRQYTPEGTFKAFSKHLDRLKKMGVQTLWFMPVNPISKIDRKGSLGSYYAVADYTAINPEFGTMGDWKALVKQAHEKGFKVIIDWVPNHTGADHYWLTKHPDFYVKDKEGKAIMAADWADTRKLNYANPELRDTMIAQLKFWIKTTGIDGFRCDVAGDVPDDFWKRAISELKSEKNIFMLAEGDKPQLNADGFDATYSWNDFAMFKKIAKGTRTAASFDSALNRTDQQFPANTLRMFFTSNHDENSWEKADYETTPGAIHAPFAVMTQTIKRSVPLIYSGQEEPFLRAIRFFDRDTITFKSYQREQFYTTLLHLRKTNPALASNASFKKVVVGNEDAIYAYVRQSGNNKVLVILNWSDKEQTIKITDSALLGKVKNVFAHSNETLTSKGWNIEPWGYVIYTY
jgi:glycosidase